MCTYYKSCFCEVDHHCSEYKNDSDECLSCLSGYRCRHDAAFQYFLKVVRENGEKLQASSVRVHSK